MKEIRKKSCGFSNSEPMICCSPNEIQHRNFRVTTDKPWIWDVTKDEEEDDEDRQIEKSKNTNILFNRLNGEGHHWNYFNNLYRPNNFHSFSPKPIDDLYNFNEKSKKNFFFYFEDPKTSLNCPPSFSNSFHAPPHFRHIKPIKNFHPLYPSDDDSNIDNNVIYEHESNSIFSNSRGTTARPIIFPSNNNGISTKKLFVNSQQNCGVSINSRIIGGDDAVSGQFPW